MLESQNLLRVTTFAFSYFEVHGEFVIPDKHNVITCGSLTKMHKVLFADNRINELDGLVLLINKYVVFGEICKRCLFVIELVFEILFVADNIRLIFTERNTICFFSILIPSIFLRD